MSKTLSRVLWVIAGALPVIAGVVCRIPPDAAFSSISRFMGIAKLFSGISKKSIVGIIATAAIIGFNLII